MSILNQLISNKGTTSTKLGKELAAEVLRGNTEILKEAVKYVLYKPEDEKSKNVRAGAAKIIEKVSEKNPELVAPYLQDIIPALELPEPQTRWMIIMVFGYCSKYNLEVASKGISYARGYINERQGVCLSGSAEIYLGNLGANSEELAETVFPILIDAYGNPLENEMDWVLEAFIRIFKNLSPKSQGIVLECANEQKDAYKPSTQKRAQKIIKLSEKVK